MAKATLGQKCSKHLHSQGGAYLFFALTALAAALLYAARVEWSWFPEVALYAGKNFVLHMFLILGGLALFHLFYLLAGDNLRGKRPLQNLHLGLLILSGVLFGWTLVIFLNNPANNAHALVSLLPYVGLALGLPFAFVLFPNFKKVTRTVLAAILTVAIVVPVILANVQSAVVPFALAEQGALVLDRGDDTYSIVFATNRPSFGGVQIAEGETYLDLSFGERRLSRTHSVIVPRDALNGKTYTVIADEVLEYAGCSGKLGKTLSITRTFKGAVKESLNLLAASDWHDDLQGLYAAIAQFPETPDIFLMMGDAASMYDSEEELIAHTIAVGAHVTNGEFPAIIALGNHETFGPYSATIPTQLGLDRTYFQVTRGNFVFNVLDGRDDAKDHFNAGKSYDNYRNTQLDWYENLPVPEKSKHVLTLVHMPEFYYPDPALQARFHAATERLATDLQISGHTHVLDFARAGQSRVDDKERVLPTVQTPILVDGGPKDGGYSGVKIVSQVQIDKNGLAKITARAGDGELMLQETLQF
ncbi:MAG: metallophosphoesterase [Oscillospiraceae bacterium]|jgi:hypothetical protein|nr:metallophosphoesterase [Oscillospiraceae bacterium]